MDQSMILLVPVLVLGVVMAFAFAGCGAFGTAETDAPPEKKNGQPTNGQHKPKHPPVVVVPTPADAYPNLILREKDNSTDPGSTKSLRSYWRLAEAAVTEDAADSDPVEPRQPGKYRGGVGFRVAGVLRQGSDPKDFCAEFNGTDAFVQVPNSPLVNPPADFTLEAWIRPAALPAGVESHVISSFQLSGSAGFMLSVVGSTDTLMKARVQVGDGLTTQLEADMPLNTPAVQARGGWHYLVATFGQPAGGSKTLRLFVDGGAPPEVVDGAQPLLYKAATENVPGDCPFRIGAGPGVIPTTFFKGQIDEVALYGKALGDGLIAQHFAQATTK